ncbi:nuclease A inhibitor family protein [Pontibacter sp. SGAir0037]|uniref:nuclease A inhibitor family protein n=1 Tax=Pontibacter sp. SGAir0037 TaxID=2571030 RepID=UPI0010CD2613|nr:nuclease A inhibitor family protein [Pontibacter sp. SGAir0037]QCR21776.1 sugar-non-specific nuclease inhibitor NuiA-like protein [Pontibacter sp. SGAir0037]
MKLEQLEIELKKAVDGLLMMSETDEPFEFYFDEQHNASQLNEETVRKLAGMPAGYPMEAVEVDYFFRNMVKHEDEQQAKRFQHLLHLLQDNLQGVKAYRVGEQRITVLILGLTEDEIIAGLKTVLVET